MKKLKEVKGRLKDHGLYPTSARRFHLEDEHGRVAVPHGVKHGVSPLATAPVVLLSSVTTEAEMKRVKFVASMWSICGGGGGMVEPSAQQQKVCVTTSQLINRRGAVVGLQRRHRVRRTPQRGMQQSRGWWSGCLEEV